MRRSAARVAAERAVPARQLVPAARLVLLGLLPAGVGPALPVAEPQPPGFLAALHASELL